MIGTIINILKGGWNARKPENSVPGGDGCEHRIIYPFKAICEQAISDIGRVRMLAAACAAERSGDSGAVSSDPIRREGLALIAAAYGMVFFDHLSADMKSAMPGADGFSPRNLRYCQRFYELYKSEENLPQLVAELVKEFNMPHILSVRGLILVVEDRLTEIYLRELFSDIPMSFVVAGGCQAVKALVNDLRRRDNSEVQRVFGIVDCDFAKSNFQRWRDAEKGTVDMFRLVRNETENYLLDGKVMCKAARRLAAPKPLDEDLIDNVILREASGQKFWIACCVVRCAC